MLYRFQANRTAYMGLPALIGFPNSCGLLVDYLPEQAIERAIGLSAVRLSLLLLATVMVYSCLYPLKKPLLRGKRFIVNVNWLSAQELNLFREVGSYPIHPATSIRAEN